MPAKKNQAFRRATRGHTIMPPTQTDMSTNVSQESLEQVSQKLLSDHYDLEQRCNLSFLQIDSWLSQQQATVKSLQGILEKLEKDSNTTKNIVSSLVDQPDPNVQNNTQSKQTTDTQSQLATCTDLSDTIATIQSKIQALHQEAQLEVLNRFQFEKPNIVKIVIQQLRIPSTLEKTLKTFRDEIQGLMRVACTQVQESSESNILNHIKQYKEQYEKDLEAQLGEIHATVTNNHELQNQFQAKLAQECRQECDRRLKCEFEKLENRYNQGYQELQAQVDGFQKIFDKFKVDIKSRTQEDISQFKEDVTSGIQTEHRQHVDGLTKRLNSIQKDLTDGADIAKKNDIEFQKVKTNLSKLHNLIKSETERHADPANNQYKISNTQMEALRNHIRCEVEAIIATHDRLSQRPDAQSDQQMFDAFERSGSGVPNTSDNTSQHSGVMEKLNSILATCNNLAQS